MAMRAVAADVLLALWPDCAREPGCRVILEVNASDSSSSIKAEVDDFPPEMFKSDRKR